MINSVPQKNFIIEALGCNQAFLSQFCKRISPLINKEIDYVLSMDFASEYHKPDKIMPDLLIFHLDELTIDALNQLIAMPLSSRPVMLVIAEEGTQKYMRLSMQAGARDFLSHPFDDTELVQSINKIIFDLVRRQQKGILTTVMNAKGGSGGSFIACNLAHITSVLSELSTVLLDLDLQFGVQSLNLNVSPDHTIVDAIQNAELLDNHALKGYMSVYKSGLHLLTAKQEQLVLPGEISTHNLELLLTLITNKYERIFIDLPRLIDPLSATILQRSDQIIIIVQQSMAHLRDANRLSHILIDDFNISTENILIVINRYNPNSNLTLNDIENTLKLKVLSTIPNDYVKVSNSTDLGISLYDFSRNSAITEALISLTKLLKIELTDTSEKSFFKKLFNF